MAPSTQRSTDDIAGSFGVGDFGAELAAGRTRVMASPSRASARRIVVESIAGVSLEVAPPPGAAQAELAPIRASWNENVAMSALRFN